MVDQLLGALLGEADEAGDAGGVTEFARLKVAGGVAKWDPALLGDFEGLAGLGWKSFAQLLVALVEGAIDQGVAAAFGRDGFAPEVGGEVGGALAGEVVFAGGDEEGLDTAAFGATADKGAFVVTEPYPLHLSR